MLRFLSVLLALTVAPLTLAASIDWSQVATALGKEGATQPGNVYRVGLPRSDLKVTLDGVAIKPGLALGGWLAFAPMGNQAMVMGDLVLTGSEVNPVIKKLQDSGFEITALHNHLLRAEPMTMYMHVLGRGEAVALAKSLHDALALTATPMQAGAAPSAAPSIDFDTAAVDQALGQKGKNNNGIYQFNVPRSEAIKDHGMEIPAAMGSATVINFQPTGGGKAAITGDFVMPAAEVNPVMKALRDNGIEITALHSHMLTETPRMYFMHFWANDDAQKLAKGLRAALDKSAIKKGE